MTEALREIPVRWRADRCDGGARTHAPGAASLRLSVFCLRLDVERLQELPERQTAGCALIRNRAGSACARSRCKRATTAPVTASRLAAWAREQADAAA